MNNVYYATRKTLIQQYFEVGQLNSDYIVNQVKSNERKRSKHIVLRRKILNRIFIRLTKEKQFEEFFKCLHAWAEGAGVTTKQALELLDDNTGCQTAMGRFENGIVLIHTEEELEDIEARMTSPEIIVFTINNEKKFALTYNNMMPGAAVYGGGENYVLAVDALFLTEEKIEKANNPILANIISWMLWRNEENNLSEESIRRIVSEAGDCVDGYAINIVTNESGESRARKISFARTTSEIEELTSEKGSVMRQLNIIDPKYIEGNKEIANYRLPYRRFYRGYWNYYKERLNKIDNDIDIYQKLLMRRFSNNKIMAENILNEIVGPLKKNYINEVVGAVCITIVKNNNIENLIGIIKNQKLVKKIFL